MQKPVNVEEISSELCEDFYQDLVDFVVDSSKDMLNKVNALTYEDQILIISAVFCKMLYPELCKFTSVLHEDVSDSMWNSFLMNKKDMENLYRENFKKMQKEMDA